MPESTQRPLRIAVVSARPAGMCLAESLLSTAPVFVDLITSRLAPAGLLHSASTRPDERTPRLRLIGNVRMDTDITLDELHELYDAVVTPDARALATTDTATLTAAALASADITAAVFPDRALDVPPRLPELLDARGVPVISWEGGPTGDRTDWEALELAARGVPVCM